MSRDIDTAEVIDTILRGLVLVGMAGSIIIAPSAAQIGGIALKKLDKRKKKRETSSQKILYYMRSRNLVNYERLKNGKYRVRITEMGLQRAAKAEFKEMRVPKLERWDGLWRLVLFDIPEIQRQSRTAFTRKLRLLNFFPLQKSAWVHAYPCDTEIENIRQVYEIDSRAIVVAEISNLDRNVELKKHFKI